jgi:hypothetical protein
MIGEGSCGVQMEGVIEGECEVEAETLGVL